METVTLSSKGQLVIPSPVRARAGLHAGDQLEVHYQQGEIRLRPVIAAKASTLNEVAGCLAKAIPKARTKQMTNQQTHAAISARLKAEDAATMSAKP